MPETVGAVIGASIRAARAAIEEVGRGMDDRASPDEMLARVAAAIAPELEPALRPAPARPGPQLRAR